ncbi:hypothetical protein TNCV_36461 [Trichonephila clavipes]|nr:hypothetical protein TNCV_36461 [Trichonephila clavipes]
MSSKKKGKKADQEDNAEHRHPSNRPIKPPGGPLSRPQVAAVAEWYRYRIVACLFTSSSPLPLKTRRVGQRCTLNMSRAETSLVLWCDR